MIFWIRRPRMKALLTATHKMFQITVCGQWWIFRMGQVRRHTVPDTRVRRWCKPWTWWKTWTVYHAEGHCERTDGPYAYVRDGDKARQVQTNPTTTLDVIVAAFREAGER